MSLSPIMAQRCSPPLCLRSSPRSNIYTIIAIYWKYLPLSALSRRLQPLPRTGRRESGCVLIRGLYSQYAGGGNSANNVIIGFLFLHFQSKWQQPSEKTCFHLIKCQRALNKLRHTNGETFSQQVFSTTARHHQKTDRGVCPSARQTPKGVQTWPSIINRTPAFTC